MGVNKKGKHKKSRARKQNTEATSDAGDTEKGKLKEDNDSVDECLKRLKKKIKKLRKNGNEATKISFHVAVSSVESKSNGSQFDRYHYENESWHHVEAVNFACYRGK